ncbi:MAG TPA: ATP synthase subunit C [Gammaproteobacteria bacterium]|nr:ATP synthase subunit C [Gammaproteobacteria bacterium]
MPRLPAKALLPTALTGLLALAGTGLLLAGRAFAEEAAARAGMDPEVLKWGFLAAALATGLSALAAGYAVAHVGSAAVGALAEKPDLMGRVLVLVGLAEGIAIYGLIISILILNQLG